jgi:uncharacterized DUF497 family protein
MPKWNGFCPRDFEYDYEGDELHAHHVNVEEVIQCFHNHFAVRRNKRYKDRFKLIGRTDQGRKLCVIFQLKKHQVVRIITGWEV